MSEITIVATRKSDMPVAPVNSTLKECIDCGNEVWVAKKQMLEPIPKDEDLESANAICLQCYKKVKEPNDDLLTDEHREYLEALRESGITNMFGAPRYLMAEFGVTKEEAFAIFNAWAKEKI